MKNLNRHLIFTSGRSGSNYVSNTINLSPQCVNFGEVLGDWTLPFRIFGPIKYRNSTPDEYLDYIFYSASFFYIAQLYSAYAHLRSRRKVLLKARSKVTSIGIKDFLVTCERRNCLDYIKRNTDIKLIYLYRGNILKRYISGLHMGKSNVSTAYKKVDVEGIVIDLEHMVHNLKIYEKENIRQSKFVDSLEYHSILKIDYEEYFASAAAIQSWNQKLFNFLEVEPVLLKSSQKKILPDSLKYSVSNSSDVVNRLSGTSFEKYLY